MKNKEQRAREVAYTLKLQGFLGKNYEIRYDDCDSGLTRCYYKGELYKSVEDGAIDGSTNVGDYNFFANR